MCVFPLVACRHDFLETSISKINSLLLKKCGHMGGGKVLVPAQEFVQKLVTVRLAADVLDVPTLIIARTDAESASFIRSEANSIDHPFLAGERSSEALKAA